MPAFGGMEARGELVIHDEENQEFHLILDESSQDKAVLQYERMEKDGISVYKLYHVEVPRPHRGRGIAKVIAKEAFKRILGDKDCEEKRVRLVLTCTYLQKYYIENRDEYKGCDIQL